MSDESVESRLAAVEERLARIEDQLAPQLIWPQSSPTKSAQARSPQPPSPGAQAAQLQSPAEELAAARAASAREAAPRSNSSAAPAPTRPPQTPSSFATSILGWGGAVAFVMAAAYLIRLGIDSGWLTPTVQITAAVVGAFLLIGTGFGLRQSNPAYAGYLPACGVVILFLAIYGGHLYYGLIGAQAATLFVVGVCALSLWLCKVFNSDLYALFAVVGSYSAPFLLASKEGSITDLVIYFSAWSVVFSIYAIWYGRRLIYLLALYLALVGFDVIWKVHAPTQWVAAMSFQAVQFVVFGIATAWFSIRRREPMDTAIALAHLPPLLLFYALQYYVLDQHVPALAPWISFASVAAVGLIYLVARRVLDEPLPGGELLLWCYLALVLFHAGYLEAWPKQWAPWASFILIPAAAIVTLKRKGGLGPLWILWGTVAMIFLINYLSVITNINLEQVPGSTILAIAYAALLYAGYYLISGREGLREIKMLLIYAGHVSAMAAAVQLLSVPIVQSTAWGLLALACLAISMWKNNRVLGQSSLLVFGATAGKVLLYDLSDAQPMARIISLVVLGATFYVGGLFYQRLVGARSAA
jgi:uncharacterized membrane protein